VSGELLMHTADTLIAAELADLCFLLYSLIYIVISCLCLSNSASWQVIGTYCDGSTFVTCWWQTSLPLSSGKTTCTLWRTQGWAWYGESQEDSRRCRDTL